MDFINNLRSRSQQFINSLRTGVNAVKSVANQKYHITVTPEDIQKQQTPVIETPKITPIPKIIEAISYNETRGEGDPYAFSRFSGSKDLGDALGKYQITEGELKTYAPRYLGKKIDKKAFLSDPSLQDRYMAGKLQSWRDLGYSDDELFLYHRGGLNAKPDQYAGYVNAAKKYLTSNP